MSKNKMPMPGEKFNDKNGKINQVITIAKHCETGEKLVVYQALYGDFDVRAVSVEQYYRENTNVSEKASEEKSSDVKSISEGVVSYSHNEMSKTITVTDNSNYREINLRAAETDIKIENYKDECPEGMNLLLYAFLETDTVRDRLKLVRDSDNRKYIDNKCIDDMAASIDVAIEEGDLDERIRQLISCLDTMKRFEVFRR